MTPRSRARRRLATASILWATWACGGDASSARGAAAGAPHDASFVDAAGRVHALAEPATRIVSLVPSATITLREIGAGDALVGRTDYDTAAWLAGVPSVGGGLDPNLEAIVALDPDVVIRFEGEQDPRTPASLDRLGIRHVAVRPASLEEIFTTIDIVGRLAGRAQQADSLAAAIRRGLAELSAEVADRPRLRVAYVLGGSPPWVSGPGTFIDEILALLGGDNVFSDLSAPYAAVSPEALRTREIDVVLVSHRNAFDESLTPRARIEAIGDGLENPGPGVVEAARRVARAMHGGGGA